MPGPEPPGEDVVAAAQPHVERRHRLDRVLLDQRRERVHVVALERLDVAREQLRVGLVDRARGVARARGRSPRAWPGPAGARCSRTRRSSRAAPRPRPPSSAAPRTGSGRRAGAAADAGARRRARAGSSPRDGDAILGRVVRHRLDPGHLGQRVQVRLDRLARRPEVHRPRAPLAAVSMSRQTFVAIR